MMDLQTFENLPRDSRISLRLGKYSVRGIWQITASVAVTFRKTLDIQAFEGTLFLKTSRKLPKGVRRKTAKGRTYYYYEGQRREGGSWYRRLPPPDFAQFDHEYAAAMAEEQGLPEPEWTPPPRNAFVYFIGAANGPVKIGWAFSPTDRMRDLQIGSPVRLELLATVHGGQPQEFRYHARFAAHRLHGEWFTRCPEIETEIARLAEGADQMIIGGSHG